MLAPIIATTVPATNLAVQLPGPNGILGIGPNGMLGLGIPGLGTKRSGKEQKRATSLQDPGKFSIRHHG